MAQIADPSLFQINTRVWLTQLSEQIGRPATLDDIPDAELDQLAKKGFDWVWFLSVWETGLAGQKVSRTSDARYDRNGNDLQSHGLYLDLPPWRYHVFDLMIR